MAQKLQCSAIIIGAVLLVAAVALAMQIDATKDRAEQRGAVVQAVNHLQNGCLTCHQTTTVSPLLDISIQPVTYHSAAHPESQQSQYDSRLADVGERILALPATNSDRIMTTFLATYRHTRQITSENYSDSLSLIEKLEAMLHNLENRTNPNQIRRAENRIVQPAAAILTVPLTSGAALITHMLSQQKYPQWTRVYSPCEFVMPLEQSFADHRRGPPAGASFFLSIGVGWETAVF